ncbi:GntR family transcriptional regulator [Streptomyces sp. NPDC050145]|uniref:GntR family transcriptional regulator n=1 Tax=Streptomyces sp. NPDC050145 TaxID=3365602 RepID=UPI0037B230AA
MNDKSGTGPRVTSEEIADELRERIRTGALKAGVRLPTQAALAKEFGVERGAVRQALHRLQSDGLLTNVSRGSPPQVAPGSETPAPGARSARSILVPRLQAAFEEEHVQVDVACLTAETLMLALGEALRVVYDGSNRPASIRLRLLLPSLEQDLDYPSPADGWGQDAKLDDAVRARTRAQRTAQSTVLRNSMAGLRRFGVDARIDIRYTVGTPSRKAYLLNRREVLIGHYIPALMEREVEEFEGGRSVVLCDVEGFDTPMFVFDRANGAVEAAFVQGEQKMFDGLWEHVPKRRA